MRKFKYYKYEDCTDLIIEPMRTIWLKSPNRLKVKALLYTIGYPGKIHLMDIDEWAILESDYNKWKLWEQK